MSNTKKYTTAQRLAKLEKQIYELQLGLVGAHKIMQKAGLLDKKEIE